METKTFEAFTMRDALKAVKTHFGQDAVILNTREKKIEGARGKVYEVTASKNSEVNAKGQRPAATAMPGLKDNLIEMMDYFRGLERNIKSLSEEVAKRQDLFRIDSGLHEIRALLCASGVSSGSEVLKKAPEHLHKVFQRLKTMNVDDGELERLLDYLKSIDMPKANDAETLATYYQGYAIKWMMKRLKIAPVWSPAQGERVVHVLVGPSGSGKSSTIAKVAAIAQQKTQKKILVVSFDNKRLAAREQLRVIAKVLGLSYEVIDEPAQLQEVLQKNRDWDLCFVDTSAECPRSSDDISDLLVLKDLDLPIKFHLCLSITEKEAQLDRMVRGFSPLGLESVVFSRLDESWSYGEIFNLCIRWSLPLSYFGVGREIPADLERASRERVIERVFGL